MPTLTPSETLGAFCDQLRHDGANRPATGPLSVQQLLARCARALISQCPTDRELAGAVARLSDRAFTLPPPPPEALPLVNPGAVYARWAIVDREEVARAIVSLPAPKQEPALALSLFELFVRTPGEQSRARLLVDAMPTSDALALMRFRLALAEHRAGNTRPDWGALLQPLRRLSDAQPLKEALRLASSFELQDMPTARQPAGLAWLAPLAEGRGIANVALALLRRPALGDDAPRIIDWLVEAGPPPWLEDADEADRRGDFAGGTRLLIAAMADHGLPGDRERVLAARSALLEDHRHGTAGASATFALPTFAQPTAPRNGWNSTLSELFERDPIALSDENEAAIATSVGDRRLVAEFRLGAKDPAAALDAGLVGRARVLHALDLTEPRDERTIANDPDAARLYHYLMDPGLARSVLALRMLGAGLCPLSTSDLAESPVEQAEEAATDKTAGTAAEPAEDDDHHAPEHRVAAARILIESNQIDAASAIALSLLRKADRVGAPPELYTLIADLLELDEPPEELMVQLGRALDDERKNAPLLALFEARPLAAFGLHEQLYDFALDPSRPDGRRLVALTAWLGIWRATETPPDAWGLRRIRETSEALLCVAAARLAGAASPLTVAASFVDATHALSDEEFADALLALSLDRAGGAA